MSRVWQILAALNWVEVTLTTTIVAVVALGLMLLFGRVPLMYNVRNLAVRWRTTFMTALAFTLVVGLFTVMLAFVNGMYRLTDNSGHPNNLIILGQGVQDEVFSSLGFTDIGDLEFQPGVAKLPDGRPLCSKETYVIVNQPVERPKPGGPRRRFVQVRGIEDPVVSSEVHHVPLFEGGEWFSQAGVRRAANDTTGSKPSLYEAVLGDGIARTLGRDRTPLDERYWLWQWLSPLPSAPPLTVGDTFVVGDQEWIVVGVMQSGGLTFDSEIWAKRELVGKKFGKEAITSMVLTADSPARAVELRAYFGESYKKASVQPLLETEYFANLSGTNLQFLVAVVILAIVMAAGGVFGVMNTMFAAIAQRTKDIGVMRLVGFGRTQILMSFLLESMFIALAGGMLGCLLGAFADGWTATSIVGSGQGGGKSVVLRLVVDWTIISRGMLLALFTGILGGFIPALFAMVKKPLDALR